MLGGWVCSVVALVVRNAEQASQTRTTRTFICSDVLMRCSANFALREFLNPWSRRILPFAHARLPEPKAVTCTHRSDSLYRGSRISYSLRVVNVPPLTLAGSVFVSSGQNLLMSVSPLLAVSLGVSAHIVCKVFISCSCSGVVPKRRGYRYKRGVA